MANILAWRLLRGMLVCVPRAADKASLRNMFKVFVSAGGDRSVHAGNGSSGKQVRTVGQAEKCTRRIQEPQEKMEPS